MGEFKHYNACNNIISIFLEFFFNYKREQASCILYIQF